MYQTYGFYRFRCSPSDLSGKYGAIDISTNVEFEFDISGFDDLMIPMNLLAGKSVGFQCSDSMTIIACAAFEDYTYVKYIKWRAFFICFVSLFCILNICDSDCVHCSVVFEVLIMQNTNHKICAKVC